MTLRDQCDWWEHWESADPWLRSALWSLTAEVSAHWLFTVWVDCRCSRGDVFCLSRHEMCGNYLFRTRPWQTRLSVNAEEHKATRLRGWVENKPDESEHWFYICSLSLSSSSFFCNIYYSSITWKPQQKTCIWIQRRQNLGCDLTVQLECHENTKNMYMSKELSSP